MENIVNFDYYEDTTSQDSSDESYYSVSSFPVLPSYEEFDNYDYSSDTSSLSIYSGTFELVNGQRIPIFYPAPVNWIEVLGVFLTEVRGTTFYQPLFYYVPVYSNIYCPLSSDVGSELYETESTDYFSADSDTDVSSSSSDTYYTAEESEFYFEPEMYDSEAEEVYYLNDTNVENTNFECSVNNESDLSGEKVCLASESNYEDTYFDNVENQNEDNGHCRSENSASICDDKSYKDIVSHAVNTFKKKESNGAGDFNSESYSEIEYFPSGNLARSCDDNDSGNISSLSKNSMIESLEKTFKAKFLIDKTKVNDVMISPYIISDSSADNIKSNKVDKHRPLPIRDISERQEFSEKSLTNTFEFGYVNNKNCQKQGLKKCNTFEDLSVSKQEQYLKKHDSLENLSRFEDNKMYEKDFPCDNPEIGEDSYEGEIESLPFDPDDFEFTEEEVKYMKDQIYLRALSGKLYQKTHIPAVAVLPTIYEEHETFGETDKQQTNSHTSCLTDQQGVLNGSLCNLFDPSVENDETSEDTQQKPKKKKLERFREFLARIFCCVKPP